MTRNAHRWTTLGLGLLLGASGLLAACGGSSGGDPGSGALPPGGGLPPPGAPSVSLGGYDPLPGVVFATVGTFGGSGPGGNFRAGDYVTIQFTLKTDAGLPLDLTLMDTGAAYISGPTFNYNRVIPSQNDLRTASAYLGSATWQYTFPIPLPTTYAPPYNDTPSFGAAEGELTGQLLLDGTYTIGLETSELYIVDGKLYRDPGSLVTDILLGSATAVTSREVVTGNHCNQCHSDLRYHDDRRSDVRLCVLCHTSGAEDRNDPAIAAGTVGTSIDFRVMVHKIHMGHHLPSVLGMTTDALGNRVYAQSTVPLGVTKPYILAGFAPKDYSGVVFPVWPSLNIGMPRDYGYTALGLTPGGAAKQAAENEFKLGPVACSKCHGDPDGPAGPIVAPVQGDLHETQPSRHACGSCHDDIDWSLPYAANNDVMPANPGACNVCHPATGPLGVGLYPVRSGHLHPLLDPVVNKGLLFNVASVNEDGVHNANGRIDPGETLSLTFTITEGDGVTPVLPSQVNSMTTVIAGPTTNYNLVLSSSLLNNHPDFGAGPPYVLNPPQLVLLERVGLDGGLNAEVFATTRAPHLNLAGGTGNPQQTKVYTRTALGFAGSSPSAIGLMQNYIDVAPGTGASFIAGPPDAGNAAYTSLYVVVDEGDLTDPGVLANPGFPAPMFPPPPTTKEEYNRIIWRQGDRLWLAAPLRSAHAAGANVKLCTLALKTQGAGAGFDYALTAATGTLTEDGNDFGGFPVICSYTTDFMMPSLFPPPLNDSPDLGETWGEWKAKPIVKGTYTVDLYGSRTLTVAKFAVPGPVESQTYNGASVAGDVDFLVIDDANLATPGVDPYAVISAAENCYKCHNDLYFHGGGRRSFGTCIMCHGDAGAEDRARYTSSNGADSTGVTVSFRTMLHKIHMGEHLPNGASYVVVGNGGTGHQYDEVVFPALPAGVRECVKCHGNAAWQAPQGRDHPTAQTLPTRVWRSVCGACHDAALTVAHIDAMTSPAGVETCQLCHGAGRDWDVVREHFPR